MDEVRQQSEMEQLRKKNAEPETEIGNLREPVEESLGCGVETHGNPSPSERVAASKAAKNKKKKEKRKAKKASKVAQDTTYEMDSSSLVTGSEMRQRRAKLASGPSTGSTVLLQQEFIKNAEKKAEELQASPADKSIPDLRASTPVHKNLRESPLSSVAQDTTYEMDSSSLVTDSELRQRRAKLASGPSTGSTVLLQEEFIKNAEKKADELQASPADKSIPHLRASTPVHKNLTESPLSSDAIFSQSHAGLFNLCVVCLVAIIGRLIIENLMKYGLLMQTDFWFSSNSRRDWPLLVVGLSLPVLPLCSFFVEKLASQSKLPEWMVVLSHIIIVATSILYPSYVIHRCKSAMLSGLILIMVSIVSSMKLISFAHANNDIRALSKNGEKEEVFSEASSRSHPAYPANLTASDITYFMVAPTLCYQIGYPRTKTIRKGWVVRQILKLLAFTGLIGFIIEQYINPTIKNSSHPLKGSHLKVLERVLKLSIPTLYVWLCLFYCFFHLWLNILAELLRFGDREFYKDWWNAKTVEEYWRMWNMPVHRWILRHLYFPCIRAGLSKPVAIVVVFILSAVFHEVCIGIPCHMLRYWAFLGILFQVPLVFLTNYLQRRFQNLMLGNMVFWFFFCIVGQPMCILLYYHDVMNQQQQTLSSAQS